MGDCEITYQGSRGLGGQLSRVRRGLARTPKTQVTIWTTSPVLLTSIYIIIYHRDK